MMNLDLSAVKPIDKKNTREGGNTTKKATFNNFRFSLNSNGSEKFSTGAKLWKELDFDNNGFAIAKVEEGIVLMLVPQGHAMARYYTTPKGDKKSNPFFSNVLQEKLVAEGVLTVKTQEDVKANDGKPVHQYFKAEEITATLPEGVLRAFILVADDRSDVDSSTSDDSNETSTPEVESPQADVQDAPVPDVVNAGSEAEDDEWD